MSEKDKANPRQRIIMEQRWADAREKCAAKTCMPASRYHVAGCERRQQKVQVTNLNTGVTSEATIVHSDARAVKDVLDQHEKQAVLLTPEQAAVVAARPDKGYHAYELPDNGGVLRIPEEVVFPDSTYWDEFEKGEPGARKMATREDLLRLPPLPEPAPARPWWKFWGRRG